MCPDFWRVWGSMPGVFWLLMDLFDQLSDRGEMLDQLGRNGVALKTVTWVYAGLSALLSVVMVVAQRTLTGYSWFFLIFTAFLLLTVLLLETGNSLVNPEEGLVLARQPINGATYTAAKLTHLARIVLYLTIGMNAVPAFLGLFLKGAGWSYPLFHLGVALGVGLVVRPAMLRAVRLADAVHPGTQAEGCRAARRNTPVSGYDVAAAYSAVAHQFPLPRLGASSDRGKVGLGPGWCSRHARHRRRRHPFSVGRLSDTGLRHDALKLGQARLDAEIADG